MDIGPVIGGGLGVIGSLIGGHMQQKAQESANRTNLQIANANNALQREMFNQQLQYNSFQNQRKMLEDAGYSPYALFNTSPVTAPSAPQLNTPTMQSEMAFGAGVGNAMGSLANIVNMLSDASNKNAEANQKQIQNKALPYILELQQKGMLSQNKALELQNILSEATQKENVTFAGLRNSLLGAQIELTTSETARILIENALQVKYGATMKEHEIMKLQGEIYKNWYEGKLTKKQLEYLPTNVQVMLRQIKVEEQNASTNALNARTNAFNAQTNRLVGSANASYLHSSAGLLQVQKSIQQRDLDYLNEKGYSKISFELIKLRNEADLLNRQYVQKGLENTYLYDTMQNRIELIYQEAQRAIERGDWYEGQLMMSVINPFSGFTK